jgi:mutator protein MutT
MGLCTEPLECVAFILIANGCVLVEKRSEHKRLLPGVLAIPGGHVDEGESAEAALVREVQEELNIIPLAFSPVCMLLHEAEEYRQIHYFVVTQWDGEMVALEAESVRWLPLDEFDALDVEIDKVALTILWNEAPQARDDTAQ